MSRAQLVEAGIHPSRVKRWTASGALHRLHFGVYAVGHLALAPHGQEQAALLACGKGTALTHATAAHMWGLLPMPPPTVHVTVSGRQIRPKWGMVSEARVRRLIRDGELERALERAGQTTGAARMRQFLRYEAEPAITRSKGERMMRRLLTQARLPHPRFNTSIEGWSVDCVWKQEKLVVEFDGFKYHGHRRAFENDRRKDVALADLGYQVLRFTWRQLEKEPFAVIASIVRALDRRRVHAG